MSPNKLPKFIQPVRLCRQAPAEGVPLSGEILISELSDICDELKGSSTTPVKVALTFRVDEEGYCYISGQIAADVPLTCQRCLQPMRLPLQSAIMVSPVASYEEAKRLPERYEPLLMTEGEVTLAEWIAEELHLALPLVPRHADPRCHDQGVESKS